MRTPPETIKFYERQAELAWRGLEHALFSGNHEMAVFNAGQIFTNRIMQGLIMWRLDRDPTEPLRSAVECVLEMMNRVDLTFPSDELPLEQSAVFASLLRMNHCEVELSGLTKDRRLDALIANDLLGYEPLGDQSVLIASIRSSLARKTYTVYSALLSGKICVEEGVKEAERLFLSRRKDAFYTGGDETAGGGEDNEFVVDYVLGAILKKLGVSSGTIHAWKW